MASNLVNGVYTELQDAMDSVLRAIHSIGSDSYEYGKRYISSRAKDRSGNSNYRLTSGANDNLYINGDSGNTNGALRGKLPFILNADISSDKFKKLRVNPACNFSDGTVRNDVMIAYGSHSNVVNDDDSKYGYIQYPKDAVEGASRNQSIKTCVWTAGKAVGTFKQLVNSIDICGDVTSGVNVYRTYYPQNGFPCNVEGITGEYEVTDGNSYKINILTGERTEILSDSPLKNIGYPSYFSDVVELGGYIYFIDQNSYIEKIDKSTLELVAKSSSTHSTSYNMFSIGDNLYLWSYSETRDGSLYQVNKDTLSYSSVSVTDVIKNIPNYMKYNVSYNTSGISFHNLGDKYIVYSNVNKFGLCCSDLLDVAGTVISELCQFNIPKGSFRQLSDTVACLSAYGNDLPNDLKDETSNILKVSLDNGQVFSIAEWETPFENTGNKEIRITIAE